MENENLFYRVTKALCERPWSNKALSEKLNAKHGSVSTYMSSLRRAGYADMNPDTFEYYIPEERASSAMEMAVKRGGCEYTMNFGNGEAPKQAAQADDGQNTQTEFAEYIAHLNWLLNEYIPHLESENKKAQQHANDLLRQMNAFVGTMKQAKLIHNRWVEKQDDMMQ